MDYKQAVEYINSIPWENKKLGVERIAALLNALDNPQKKLKFIHVAGTNGKGSICEMSSRILEAAGYKVGLFVSPFIHRFNERMQVNHSPIDDDRLAKLITYVKSVAEKQEEMPSVFEMITATAFQFFFDEQCDYVVLEVGMGGRLDATNVIDTPLVAVIATIGFDHMAHLGNTIRQIASEKAGIIKDKGDVVIYGQGGEALEVLKEACRKHGATAYISDFDKLEYVKEDTECQYFRYRGSEIYKLPLHGINQPKNACTVLETVKVLRKKGLAITDEAIRTGLINSSWPGRLEVLSKDPVFVVDGGHNPEGAGVAVESIRKLFPGKKAVVIIGVTAGKEVESIVGIVDGIASGYIAIQASTNRAMPVEILCEILRRYNKPVESAKSISSGIERAFKLHKEDEIIFAVGSLYTVAEIREYFGRKN